MKTHAYGPAKKKDNQEKNNMPPYKGLSYKKIGTSLKNEVLEHRLIAEKALGKPLPKGAVVHHVNGGKTGDIVICDSKGYHSLLHVRMRAYKATGDPNKRKCTFCSKWDDIKNMWLRKNKWNGMYIHRECDNSYRRFRYNMKKVNLCSSKRY